MRWDISCHDPTRGRRLAGRVARADGPISRARGLLGRAGLEPDQGLWLVPCRQVHTLFMRFPIDVIFLGRDGRVLRLCREMPPWRVSPWVGGAVSALELAAGAAGPLAPGDRLEFTRAEEVW